MSLLDKIKLLCEKNNITIPELERKLGFSVNLIYKWSNGSPSINKIRLVAKYFNVSTDYLIGLSKISSTLEDVFNDERIITIHREYEKMSEKKKQLLLMMSETLNDAYENEDKNEDTI